MIKELKYAIIGTVLLISAGVWFAIPGFALAIAEHMSIGYQVIIFIGVLIYTLFGVSYAWNHGSQIENLLNHIFK